MNLRSLWLAPRRIVSKVPVGILLEVSLRNLSEITVEILAEVPPSIVPEIALEMYSKSSKVIQTYLKLSSRHQSKT